MRKSFGKPRQGMKIKITLNCFHRIRKLVRCLSSRFAIQDSRLEKKMLTSVINLLSVRKNSGNGEYRKRMLLNVHISETGWSIHCISLKCDIKKRSVDKTNS